LSERACALQAMTPSSSSAASMPKRAMDGRVCCARRGAMRLGLRVGAHSLHSLSKNVQVRHVSRTPTASCALPAQWCCSRRRVDTRIQRREGQQQHSNTATDARCAAMNAMCISECETERPSAPVPSSSQHRRRPV
jgi:hypothetical protein